VGRFGCAAIWVLLCCHFCTAPTFKPLSTRQVKERTQESTGIHTELARLAADQWRGLASIFPGGPARAGRRKLDALLRGWAGVEATPRVSVGTEGRATDDSVEVQPAAGAASAGQRGEGGRTLMVAGQPLDEGMLQRVLAEALAPFDAVGGPGAVSKGQGDGDGGASAEEVAAVAKFVLQRYGSRADAAAAGEGKVRVAALCASAVRGWQTISSLQHTPAPSPSLRPAHRRRAVNRTRRRG